MLRVSLFAIPNTVKADAKWAFQSAFNTHSSLRLLYDLKSEYCAHFTGGKMMEVTCSIPAHYFQSLPIPDSWSHCHLSHPPPPASGSKLVRKPGVRISKAETAGRVAGCKEICKDHTQQSDEQPLQAKAD